MARSARWAIERPRPVRRRAADPAAYPCLLVKHSSKLLRKVDPALSPLQRNKVHNLELACAALDGLLMEPGEVLSFCATVGRTSRRCGYLDGLEMHNGVLQGAPGGGLCQLSNLIYWMALHLDLEILERHRHGFDLFADDDRTVPFGMGATVFYNYVDFRFRNTLAQPLLLRVTVEPPLLRGGFYSNKQKPFDITIVETEHRFFRDEHGAVWRENRVSKEVAYLDGRPPVSAEIAHNLARVRYEVAEDLLSSRPGDEPGAAGRD